MENFDSLALLKSSNDAKNIKSFRDKKQIETLEEAARLTHYYALTYKVSFLTNLPPETLLLTVRSTILS